MGLGAALNHIDRSLRFFQRQAIFLLFVSRMSIFFISFLFTSFPRFYSSYSRFSSFLFLVFPRFYSSFPRFYFLVFTFEVNRNEMKKMLILETNKRKITIYLVSRMSIFNRVLMFILLVKIRSN